MTKPSLLVINHEYPPAGGGAATVTRILLRRLRQTGLPVALLTGTVADHANAHTDEFPLYRADSRRQSNWQGSFGEFIRFFIRSIPVLFKIGREFRPTVAFSFFSIPGGLVALVQKWLFGVPYIVSIRGGDIPGFQFDKSLSRYHVILRPLIKLVLWQADRVHVNSHRLEELTRQIFPNGEIILLPNGIEPALVKVDSVWEPPLKLLFVGRLSPQKNLSVVLQALSQIPGELPTNLFFNIVGAGPEQDNLKRTVEQLGISQIVKFHGWLERVDLPPIYAENDVLLLPSLDEGMPNAALEAINHGCLVIGTQAAQISTDKFSVTNDWLVENGRDSEAWLAVFLRAINDPEVVKRDAKKIRQKVLFNLSWEKLIPKYLQLIVGEKR